MKFYFNEPYFQVNLRLPLQLDENEQDNVFSKQISADKINLSDKLCKKIEIMQPLF